MPDDASTRPETRWDPGARYRPSVLVGLPAPAPSPGPRLTGRLRPRPLTRTAVFDRDLWRPVQHVTTGLVRVVGRALGR
jgi:hypothetical protein